MNEKEKYCKNIFKKWKELKEKFRKAQRITTEEYFKEQPSISNKERNEFYKLTKELKNKCIDYLLPAEINELDRSPDYSH